MHVVLVTVTCPTADNARTIARAAVDRQLAAAAHVQAVASVYRWHDEVVEADEHTVTFRTVGDNIDGLRAIVAELHPYELAEFVAVPVEYAPDDYRRWVETNGTWPSPAPDD